MWDINGQYIPFSLEQRFVINWAVPDAESSKCRRHPSIPSQSQISSDVKFGGISPFGKDSRAGQLQTVSSCRDVSFCISL
ncbi:hypothetical protein OIU79_027713, partial [Salix purpurea]